MDIQPLDILKWIGIGIAAGFIGYFGRYLAMLILERIHKRRPGQALTAEPTKEVSAIRSDKLEGSELKLEKKKVKLEVKKAKKTQK